MSAETANMSTSEKLLLISSPRPPGKNYLEECLPPMHEFLGETKEVTFVPYAYPDHDRFVGGVRQRFDTIGVSIKSVHEVDNPRKAVEDAEAIFMGGGNSFLLLKKLYDNDLVTVMQEKLRRGTAYMGTSAGALIACPTIKTWDDMPIVLPPKLDSLGVVPFQITPHYFDPEGEVIGKSPKRRIDEFHALHDMVVVGLRERARLHVESGNVMLEGEEGAVIFEKGKDPKCFAPGEKLNFLLKD